MKAEPKVNPRRDRLRDELISQACALVASEGIAAVQARRIATLAGCSVGAIYNVFPDLDDLILQANARTLQEIAAHERAALANVPADASRLDRVQALATAYIDFAYTRETAWRALFESRVSARKPYPPWYVAIQAEAFALVEGAMYDEAGGERAFSERDRRTARLLWAATQGIVMTGLDHRLGRTSRHEVEAQVALLLSAATLGLSHMARR